MRFFACFCAVFFFVSTCSAEQLILQNLKSEHGVPFVLYQSDVQDTVAVGLAFKGGFGSDPIDGPAVGLLAPRLMAAGAGGKTTSELFEAMQDFGGDWNFNSTPDQTYGVLSAPSKGIMGAADIANLTLTQPDFPEKKLAEQREAIASRIEEFDAYPDTKAQAAFSDALSEVHPYQNYARPTAASVRLLTRADFAPWMARHITKDGILVTVVGDLQPKEAGALVDRLLDGLPEKSTITATPPMVFKKPPAQPIAISADTGDQAVVIMGSAFAFDSNLQNWTSALLLSSIFSGDQKTRLFKDIREASGATYGLQPSLNFSDANITNAISGRVAKESADATLALIKKSWDHFREVGPTDEEIANAKATLLHQLGDITRNHASMAGYLRDYLTGHWTAEDLADLPNVIEKCDLRNKELLAKLFPNNPIVVIAK